MTLTDLSQSPVDDHSPPFEQFQKLLLEWYETEKRDLPWRKTRDPYRILVAEIMLQQTQVDRVIPKYHEFLEAFPDIAALAAAPTAEVIRRWASLGYNRRAVNLQAAAREALERFGGQLPEDPALLLSLKGIGRYTANAIATFAFEQQVPVVDTNVNRILARVAGRPEPLPEKEAWELAARSLPDGRAYPWNQALMDLGATVCTARAPACLICPVFSVCKTRGVHSRSAALQIDLEPGLVAERKPAYRSERYEGSSRYFRGKAVDVLRALKSGEGLTAGQIGAAIKPDFSPDDREWAERLVAGLCRDFLAVMDGDRVRLP